MLALLAAAAMGQAIPIPHIELNHFYITLEPKTYAAIRENAWLKKEFAHVYTDSYTSGEGGWTGTYVSGPNTYIEFFGASREFPLGKGGIGMLTSYPGGADNFYSLFQSSFGARAERELMELGTGGSAFNFSHIASFKGGAPQLSFWVMEYHADLFGRAGVPVGSGQRALNKKWFKGASDSKLFGDVESLKVHLGGRHREDFETALRSMGYVKEGSVWRGRFDSIEVLSPLPGSPNWSISEVGISLQKRPARDRTERFGPGCTLSVRRDGTAIWRFR
jgi:hypothetical protein